VRFNHNGVNLSLAVISLEGIEGEFPICFFHRFEQDEREGGDAGDWDPRVAVIAEHEIIMRDLEAMRQRVDWGVPFHDKKNKTPALRYGIDYS
jgi:hypothetical protein